MSAMKIKVFADGADFDQMVQLAKNPNVKGFTTNPTLMRKAGVSDYAAFARKVLDAIPDRPISFEVFADDLPGMLAQGRQIASWGRNANVKIPVTNTEGTFCGPVIKALTDDGVIVKVVEGDPNVGRSPAYVYVEGVSPCMKSELCPSALRTTTEAR